MKTKKTTSKEKIPRALTIAGSDSGGGAGIQADLKTFAALGVHGMTAITSVTAQNTREVSAVQDLDPEIIQAQIRDVVEDIGVDAAKTGMLHTARIIEAVATQLEKYEFPLVVDPVMVAKSGAVLLEEAAVNGLKERLIPLATVATPNIPEAEKLAGFKIHSKGDVLKAAARIARLGPEAVVIKGGHSKDPKSSTDILYKAARVKRFKTPRLATSNTHGTGCCFSAAIAAHLAKGASIEEAVAEAKLLVTEAIQHSLPVGHGHGPVNPMGKLYLDAEKQRVLEDLQTAIQTLERNRETARLVPESQINLAMALSRASEPDEVAGIPGRIVKVGEGVKAVSPPRFGASRHVAATVLEAMRHDPRIRGGMNIVYSDGLLKVCKNLGLTISFYDRRAEPSKTRAKEGESTRWGAKQAIARIGFVPQIIFHRGGWGKEPMMTLLGRTASEVARMAVMIAKSYE